MVEIINRDCEVNRAGEVVLEFLLLFPDQDLAIFASSERS